MWIGSFILVDDERHLYKILICEGIRVDWLIDARALAKGVQVEHLFTTRLHWRIAPMLQREYHIVAEDGGVGGCTQQSAARGESKNT